MVPQYGVYESAGDVPFDELPDEFVLKPNHLSGAVILCRDKSKLDIAEAREKMDEWLRWNFYWQNGEWQYRDIPPKIICEKLLPGESIDYKFFCFHGEPKILNVVTRDKEGKLNTTNFDMDFQRLPFIMHYPAAENVERPEHLEEMLEIAKTLCKDFLFVRVDLYDIEGKVYFGELTFTPGNGKNQFEPAEWDRKMGDWLDLSQIPAGQLI